MNIPFRPLLLMLVMLVAFCTGCSDSGAEKAAARPMPIRTAVAESRDVPRILDAVGNVEAFSSVQIKSQVGGQIIEVPVASGQEVNQGDLLFRLDPRPFDAAVAEVKARLAKNQALLTKARKDYARYSSLVRQDVVSREAFDQIATTERTVRADIEQDRAAIKAAELDREYSEIRAPISGKLGQILVRNGNVIKANDDRTLAVINSMRPIEVRFTVAERFLPSIVELMNKGQLEVGVLPQGDNGALITGTVSAVDNEVDRTTGSIRLYAVFSNDDNRLWPGQFVRVSLVLATLQNAVVIPERALQEGMTGRFVYKATPDLSGEKDRYTISTAPVETEPGPEGLIVVSKGILAGDRVVTEGQLGIAPGAVAVDMGQR